MVEEHPTVVVPADERACAILDGFQMWALVNPHSLPPNNPSAILFTLHSCPLYNALRVMSQRLDEHG